MSGEVLVVGDSTSSYCVDKEYELTWPELRGRAREACRCVDFYFESWSGATPRSFLTQAENAAWWGWKYDWVLLIGGWNSDGVGVDEVRTIFSDLSAFCEENSLRK